MKLRHIIDHIVVPEHVDLIKMITTLWFVKKLLMMAMTGMKNNKEYQSIKIIRVVLHPLTVIHKDSYNYLQGFNII